MRCATIGLVLGAALAVSCALASQQAQDRVSPERVNQLIDRLGSVKFAERDRAMKELEAMGPAILATLRPALQSTDREIAQRVQALVRKLEDRQLAATLLTGKGVRLHVTQAPIYRAVADLAKESGYAVQATIAANDTSDRRITLDTGETTFWAALQKLCDQAELVEAISEPSGPTTAGIVKPSPALRREIERLMGTGVPGSAPVLNLTSGKTTAIPTCITGSVRIRLIKTSISFAGNIDLVLEVTGEPSLVGFEGSGGLRIDRAADDRGQSLTSLLVPQGGPPAGVGNINVGNAMNNLGLALNGIGGGSNGVFDNPPTGFRPFQVEIRLQKGEKAAGKLLELTGKIGVKTLVETEPMFVVDKILDAAKKTVKGKDGASLTVMEVAKLGNGDIRIQVSVDEVQNPAGALGGIRIQAAGKVQINGNNVIILGAGGGPRGEPSPLRLLDGKGEAFTQVETPQNGFMINGGQIAQTETVVYRPKAGQGPAARLVLPARRVFAFEVPFSFKDVVLPSR